MQGLAACCWLGARPASRHRRRMHKARAGNRNGVLSGSWMFGSSSVVGLPPWDFIFPRESLGARIVVTCKIILLLLFHPSLSLRDPTLALSVHSSFSLFFLSSFSFLLSLVILLLVNMRRQFVWHNIMHFLNTLWPHWPSVTSKCCECERSVFGRCSCMLEFFYVLPFGIMKDIQLILMLNLSIRRYEKLFSNLD